MKRFVVALIAVALVGTAAAYAEQWTNVSLIDRHCEAKYKKDADQHPTSCLLMCAKAGYGILTADGTYLKFDKAGNEKALAALKATDKKDHIRVNVTGEMKKGLLDVTELSIQ
jgi:hypothetical protein